MSASNVFATIAPALGGGVDVLVRYCGPLATRSTVRVRFGERRGGQDWVNPRDVAMVVADGEATALIRCAGGSTLEGACFAFHAQKNGTVGIRVWDNAGQPLGFYALDATTGAIEAR